VIQDVNAGVKLGLNWGKTGLNVWVIQDAYAGLRLG